MADYVKVGSCHICHEPIYMLPGGKGARRFTCKCASVIRAVDQVDAMEALDEVEFRGRGVQFEGLVREPGTGARL